MHWLNLDLSSAECQKRQFPAIDIMKLICAILVVAIHTYPFRDIDIYLDYGFVQYIARLAVPFFFITSGYFCFRKTTLLNFNPKITFTYAKKILFLYIIWTGIYFLPICVGICSNKKGIAYGVIQSVKEIVFSGYRHLWYLSATAVAVALLTVALHKKISMNKIIFTASVLYLIGLLGLSYYHLLDPLRGTIVGTISKLYESMFLTTRNSIFEGFLFVGMGALFALKKIQIKRNTAMICFGVFMLLMLLEACTLQYFDLVRTHDIYFFLAPVSFFLFYIVSHLEIKVSRFSRKARTYSSLIYFTHIWFDFLVIDILPKVVEQCTGVTGYTVHSLLRFTIDLTGAVLVSYLILRLENHKHFQCLKKLH